VFEGGVEVRNSSSMVVSLADLARRGGCRNLMLEEPETHLHDDALFESAKFLYAEELDLRGGEVDMDEAQLRVLESLERTLRAVKHALRVGR